MNQPTLAWCFLLHSTFTFLSHSELDSAHFIFSCPSFGASPFQVSFLDLCPNIRFWALCCRGGLERIDSRPRGASRSFLICFDVSPVLPQMQRHLGQYVKPRIVGPFPQSYRKNASFRPIWPSTASFFAAGPVLSLKAKSSRHSLRTC